MKIAQQKILNDLIGGTTLRNVSKLEICSEELKESFVKMREKFLRS
jgi:hypothetical protein